MLTCEFLVKNNVNIKYVNEKTGNTLLHILALNNNNISSIINWAKTNISKFDINALNIKGRYTLFLLFYVSFKKDIFEYFLFSFY